MKKAEFAVVESGTPDPWPPLLVDRHGNSLRLPDVLERQGLSLNFLSKLVMSMILKRHFVVLDNFPASLNNWEIVHF